MSEVLRQNYDSLGTRSSVSNASGLENFFLVKPRFDGKRGGGGIVPSIEAETAFIAKG